LVFGYNLFTEKKKDLFFAIKSNFFVIGYLLAIVFVKYLHQGGKISFPIDNALIIAISYFACSVFVKKKSSKKEIEGNLKRVTTESAS
jgi:hypothetical protein